MQSLGLFLMALGDKRGIVDPSRACTGARIREERNARIAFCLAIAHFSESARLVRDTPQGAFVRVG